MRRTFYASLLAILSLFVVAPLLAQVKPETMRQIQLLMAEKASRSPVEKKMASQLLQGLRESRGQKMVAGVELEPAKLRSDNRGYLEVDITAIVSEELLAKIRATGGTIIFASAKYNSIRAQVALSVVEAIAAYPEVRFIQPAVQSETVGAGAPKVSKSNLKSVVAASPVKGNGGYTLPRPSLVQRERRVKEALKKYLQEHNEYNPLVLQAGSVNSEGDRSHRTDDARNTYGYAGQGIKIGVLSDSYNRLGGAPADVLNDDLPGVGNPYGNTTPVTVVADYTASGNDEGRAMLQIVHDLAPKAQLFFATGNISEASFASNIVALRNTYGCDIVIDDLAYFDEPAFQDGIVAQAVNTVTAAGGLYFSSAGNSGSVALGTAGVWEGDFNDAGSPAFTFPGGTKSGTIHNFGSTPANGDSIIAVGSGAYNLQWSDPWGASGNDYDLFLVNTAGTVKASSTTVQSGTQNPYEAFAPPALVAGDRFIVFKSASAAVRAIHLNSNRGRLKVATTGQTHGHSCAIDAYCVAAVPATGYPFVNTNTVETFSSDGLRRIFFNADGTAITPGNFLFSTNGGTVRNKPDITAADGVGTTLPASTGLNPFFGTSAAAPHAGAIAALIKSARPSITPAQMRTLLISTALDIQTPGYDNVSGYGIIQVFQAMQSLNPVALPYINIGTITTSEGSYGNGNGSVEPGEIGNLVVQLRNSSLANASGVSATITTTNSGVTITRGTVSYGTINTTTNASNTSLPFTFAVNSSVACGTAITFQIRVTFTGGVGTVGYTATVIVGQTSLANISATLGGTPPTGANYTATSGQQTGRLVRGTVASTCAAPVANPGLTVTTGARQYDAYTFTNTTTSSQCYTVTLASANGLNIYTAAYSSAGLVPATPSTNYLAEPGQSAATQIYSFTVAAGAAFTVVVHDVNVTPASNSPYTLSVTYTACAAAPACTPITITTTTIASGATGSAYTQSFNATGGSGIYTFSLSGDLPAGLSFSGNTLSGTPTQAGSFPITISVTDVTGCPGNTKNYTLVISGTLPAAVTLTSGTNQAATVCAAFPIALQATVKDAGNNPLSGVNVKFTAPSSGPSGTFTGGVTSITVVTNASGIATVSLTPNTIIGSYTVVASVNGVAATAGFYVANVPIVVTSSADSGPGTLREAINNACPGATIIFSPGITRINLTSGELVVNNALTIVGSEANVLTVSAGNLSRVIHISPGSSTAVVNISGITLRDGKLPASSTFGGAGVLIESGIVNITSCVISNNDASAMTSFSDGGGIYSGSAGLVTIDRSSIINNITDRLGGGIAQWGAARLTITNSTISGNNATGTTSAVGYGGGLFYNTLITVTNCTVFGNTAKAVGGNIFRNASTLTMGNTIVGGGVLTAGAVAANGIDVYGAVTSTGYNLIQNTGGYTISGTTTGNQLGINPKMFLPGNYGGTTPTCLPMSNSPAINAGNPALNSGTDQRGFARLIGTQGDIGAVETNYASAIFSGTPQTATINTQFSLPLKASVTETGNLIAGDTVVFTAPATGASGTFPGASRTDTVVTNASGIATSRVFTANNIIGTYNVTASIGATYPNINFALTNTTPLPVVFGSVSASTVNCNVQIQWKTLTELNTRDFTIEYSTDGLLYTSLAVVRAKGNSNTELTYNYTHTSPAKGNLYYRIRQTDVNGNYMYSKVLSVINSCDKAPVVVYPNPAKDKLTIQLSGTARQTVMVHDAQGRLMTQISGSGGSHEIVVSNWAKGIYTLTILQESKKIYTTKIVKE